MNAIQSLEQRVRERFPESRLHLDAPASPDGRWFLDISLGEYALVVEWYPAQGFGISTPTRESFGERPDEIYGNVEAAWHRVLSLILAQAVTRPPQSRLPTLRTQLGISQVELASRLGVHQGAISKLERRDDMLISTLVNLVSALGGTLEIRAKFPGGTERILQLGESADHSPEAGSDV